MRESRLCARSCLRSCTSVFSAVFSSMLLCATAHASLISYQVMSLGGDLWRYEYALEGPAPVGGFDGLTVYFEATSFGTLSSLVAPAGWDPLLVPVDASLPADGLADLLRLDGPLVGSVGPVKFSVDVEYLGIGTPGSQRYELYVSDPFEVVAQGQTLLMSPIPEPGTLALMTLALGAGALLRGRTKQMTDRPV